MKLLECPLRNLISYQVEETIQVGGEKLAAVPFAYFRTKSNEIGYSRGWIDSAESAFVATMVYWPNAIPTGKYQNRIINGYRDESPVWSQDQNVRPQYPERLRRYFYHSNVDAHPFGFTLPLEEVDVFFDPWEQLQQWIQMDGSVPDLLRFAVDWSVRELGISKEDIGVYGSLQCGIKTPETQIKDIDFLVKGLRHTKKILNHTACQARIDLEDKTANGRWTVSRVRKHLASFDLFCGGRNIEIEFKVHRQDGDINTVRDIAANTRFVPIARDVKGIVREDIESLSLPWSYGVQIGPRSTDLVRVFGNWYDFIGAAQAGTEVIARGFFDTSQKYLWIANPLKHYIFPLASTY